MLNLINNKRIEILKESLLQLLSQLQYEKEKIIKI